MIRATATRPPQSSAERPAPKMAGEVYLRDFNGAGATRISRDVADRLVSGGIADRVSAAGHVRLKLGIRALPNGDPIHGIPAVEISRFLRGDAVTMRDMQHKDRTTR